MGAVGDTLGPYRLEAQLGEGAVGVVYRAVRLEDGEVVALKVLKPGLAADASYRQRFIREARAASEVENRHLARIVDAGEDEGRHFLAVEYASGGSLADRLAERGPLPPEDLCRLAAEIAAGLDALHASELVHRDVKPANIMLCEDARVVLTDFGLAKGRAYTVLTAPGQVVGTVDYLAPELIEGKPATAATDIYAFGCTVYECATGSAPFAGRGVFQAAVAHLEEPVTVPHAVRAELPPDFGWAVVQALAKDPEKRPPTGSAYARLLHAGATGERR